VWLGLGWEARGVGGGGDRGVDGAEWEGRYNTHLMTMNDASAKNAEDFYQHAFRTEDQRHSLCHREVLLANSDLSKAKAEMNTGKGL
jgi:hypothetical protein